MSPRQRRADALHALMSAGYANLTSRNEELQEGIEDLMTDLLHFAEDRKLDCTAIVRKVQEEVRRCSKQCQIET